MKREDSVLDIIKNEYGITTIEQLDAAIARMGYLDISIFCLNTEMEKKIEKEDKSDGLSNPEIA